MYSLGSQISWITLAALPVMCFVILDLSCNSQETRKDGSVGGFVAL